MDFSIKGQVDNLYYIQLRLFNKTRDSIFYKEVWQPRLQRDLSITVMTKPCIYHSKYTYQQPLLSKM